MSKLTILLWVLLAVAITAGALGLWANRPRQVSVDARLADSFPEEGFSHRAFASLLQQYVSADGDVDYERWLGSAESVASLDAYLAAVSLFSPDSAAERFPTRNDELAYWMYGYNAWVIKGVLLNWPLTSVTDVKAPLEVVKGMGFFYQLRFPFGGVHMSLLSVENNKIRKRFQDPRIHFRAQLRERKLPGRPARSSRGRGTGRITRCSGSRFRERQRQCPSRSRAAHGVSVQYLQMVQKGLHKPHACDRATLWQQPARIRRNRRGGTATQRPAGSRRITRQSLSSTTGPSTNPGSSSAQLQVVRIGE